MMFLPLTGLLFILLSLNFLLIGCGEDTPACDVTCVFGDCAGNDCNCFNGYEGDSCSVLTTQKFIGKWSAVDSCETNVYVYDATISASSTLLNKIQINNFGRWGTDFTITADISGTDFTIPAQTIQGITISGSGAIVVIDSNTATITVDYTAKDEFQATDQCSGVWNLSE